MSVGAGVRSLSARSFKVRHEMRKDWYIGTLEKDYLSQQW
jgi:hypothetical protein